MQTVTFKYYIGDTVYVIHEKEVAEAEVVNIYVDIAGDGKTLVAQYKVETKDYDECYRYDAEVYATEKEATIALLKAQIVNCENTIKDNTAIIKKLTSELSAIETVSE